MRQGVVSGRCARHREIPEYNSSQSRHEAARERERVLGGRFRKRVEQEFDQEQQGFRKGRGMTK